MSFQAWLKHAWFQHCLVLFLKETHTRDRASKWRHVPKFQFRCYSECCIFLKTKKEIHLFLSFSFRSGEILYLIPHGLYIYTPVFVHHFPFISRSFLCCKLQHTIRRRKNWIPLAALIVSNGPCNWAKSWDTVWGKRRPIGDEWVVSSFVWILGIFFLHESWVLLKKIWKSKHELITSHQKWWVNNFSKKTHETRKPVLLFSFCGQMSFQSLGLVENYQVDPKMSQDCMKQIQLDSNCFGFPLGGVPDSTRSRWRFLIKRLRPNPSNVDRDFVR